MNDRIENCLYQAGLTAQGCWDEFDDYARQGIEKFAELIVLECVKFCEHESNDDEHDEYDMGMWVKAESIKTAIKEHFGVEE